VDARGQPDDSRVQPGPALAHVRKAGANRARDVRTDVDAHGPDGARVQLVLRDNSRMVQPLNDHQAWCRFVTAAHGARPPCCGHLRIGDELRDPADERLSTCLAACLLTQLQQLHEWWVMVQVQSGCMPDVKCQHDPGRFGAPRRCVVILGSLLASQATGLAERSHRRRAAVLRGDQGR
jgi:hypothetical protein